MWPERTRLSISMLCVWREGSDRESRRFNQVVVGLSIGNFLIVTPRQT